MITLVTVLVIVAFFGEFKIETPTQMIHFRGVVGSDWCAKPILTITTKEDKVG